LLRRAAVFGLATAALAVLAWLDLSQLSSGYYRDLRPQYMTELILVAAVLTAGAAAVAAAWKTDWLSRLDAATKSWRAPLGTLALTTFFVFLASRSVWQTNFAMKGDTLVRSYAEHSILWMTWYLGPAITLLGLAAIVWTVRGLLRGRRLELLPLLCVIGACTYYLVNPNISSDQVWASRRFLPVILPGLTVMGFLLLSHLYDRSSIPLGKFGNLSKFRLQPQTTVAVLATLAVVGPFYVTSPFLATRSYAPQLAQVRFICDHVPDNAIVVWLGEAKNYAIQPTQAFCGVPSLGIHADAASGQALTRIAAVANEQDKRVIVGSKGDIGIAGQTAQKTIEYTDLEQTYKKFPRNRAAYTQTISLGELTAGGQVAGVTTRTEK
jgi:hypothetical protein